MFRKGLVRAAACAALACVGFNGLARAEDVATFKLMLQDHAFVPTEVKVPAGKPFTQEPYGIGLPKDQADAKKFVNDFLQKIYADGSWAKLWKATIGTIVQGDAPKPPTIGSVPGS